MAKPKEAIIPGLPNFQKGENIPDVHEELLTAEERRRNEAYEHERKMPPVESPEVLKMFHDVRTLQAKINERAMFSILLIKRLRQEWDDPDVQAAFGTEKMVEKTEALAVAANELMEEGLRLEHKAYRYVYDVKMGRERETTLDEIEKQRQILEKTYEYLRSQLKELPHGVVEDTELLNAHALLGEGDYRPDLEPEKSPEVSSLLIEKVDPYADTAVAEYAKMPEMVEPTRVDTELPEFEASEDMPLSQKDRMEVLRDLLGRDRDFLYKMDQLQEELQTLRARLSPEGRRADLSGALKTKGSNFTESVKQLSADRARVEERYLNVWRRMQMLQQRYLMTQSRQKDLRKVFDKVGRNQTLQGDEVEAFERLGEAMREKGEQYLFDGKDQETLLLADKYLRYAKVADASAEPLDADVEEVIQPEWKGLFKPELRLDRQTLLGRLAEQEAFLQTHLKYLRERASTLGIAAQERQVSLGRIGVRPGDERVVPGADEYNRVTEERLRAMEEEKGLNNDLLRVRNLARLIERNAGMQPEMVEELRALEDQIMRERIRASADYEITNGAPKAPERQMLPEVSDQAAE